MRRRAFITLLGGAVAWPLTASAQSTRPVVGFLHAESPDAAMAQVTAFHQGLNEAGYVEGRNVDIEYRWAEARPDRLPALVADLVGRRVTVIAATGGVRAALAARAGTATMPIVFITTIDPVKSGLVATFNRPGGNMTGVYVFTAALATKWLELLRELAPTNAVFALLVNPHSLAAESIVEDLAAATRNTGQRVLVVHASKPEDFEPAFSAARQQAGALIVTADNFFALHRDQLIALAARHKVPTIWNRREWTAAGGLMSYGNSVAEYYRQVGAYVAQILKGAQPADLPVVQPTKFELVINLKTAKSLGIEIPPTLLARADEVIE